MDGAAMGVLLAHLSLLLATVSVLQAEWPWVLWVEAPGGSDQWGLASGREIQYTAKEHCQRRADALSTFEMEIHQLQGASAIRGSTTWFQNVHPPVSLAGNPSGMEPQRGHFLPAKNSLMF